LNPHSDNPIPSRSRPVIAVTSGDPAGIGPEITARLFARFDPARSSAVIVGARSALDPWFDRAGLTDGKDFVVAENPAGAVEAARGGVGPETRFVVLDTGVDAGYPVGCDSEGGGVHAGHAIKRACELIKNWAVQGIVTAPISKKSLNLAKLPFSGHTEMLARYLNAPDCQMMMVHRGLRIVPLTRHVPLRDVSDSVTQEAIVTCVRVVAGALVGDFGVDAPRIAVTGLNPHAGDGGVVGNEEETVVAPALDRLRTAGIDVTGPVPADALFPQAYSDFHADPAGRGAYDAYVAMYHDQGLTPFKMLSQRRGVNVTVGLPTVRTSVDHGVAYDVAGRGVAETESLLEAYKLAEELCIRRVGGGPEGPAG
jgi:4-hydroxythreonine-4-phosphate dehydrogenase